MACQELITDLPRRRDVNTTPSGTGVLNASGERSSPLGEEREPFSLWPIRFRVERAVDQAPARECSIYRIEGERLLRRIPEAMYQRVVAGMILLLGIWMALKINP